MQHNWPALFRQSRRPLIGRPKPKRWFKSREPAGPIGSSNYAASHCLRPADCLPRPPARCGFFWLLHANPDSGPKAEAIWRPAAKRRTPERGPKHAHFWVVSSQVHKCTGRAGSTTSKTAVSSRYFKDESESGTLIDVTTNIYITSCHATYLDNRATKLI